MAVDDLSHAQALWGEHVKALITERVPYDRFHEAFDEHGPEQIKTVIEWGTQNPEVRQ